MRKTTGIRTELADREHEAVLGYGHRGLQSSNCVESGGEGSEDVARNEEEEAKRDERSVGRVIATAHSPLPALCGAS